MDSPIDFNSESVELATTEIFIPEISQMPGLDLAWFAKVTEAVKCV